MNFDQLAKWSVTAIPIVGLVFLFFQVRLQRGQHRLQDAEAHAQQAAAWAALEDDWDIALLVAKGRSAVYRFGVALSKEKAFLAAVERYVQARVKFLDVQHEGSTPEDWESYTCARHACGSALCGRQPR